MNANLQQPREIKTASETSGQVLPIEKLEAVRHLASTFAPAGLRRASMLRVRSIDECADTGSACRVWLALENLQITGSFKVRGALHAMASAREQGHRGVVAASAGNHGAGIAFGAEVLGMQAIIVVPDTTPTRKLRAMGKAAVTIERVAGGYDDAEAHALRLAHDRKLPFVSPYDDVRVASANGGSLGFEIVTALGRVPERVVVPIGGGGLATGLACALAQEAGEDHGRSKRVWTAQSVASPAFALSLESGYPRESLDAPEVTLAEGLEGGISAGGFGRASKVVAGVDVVTEEQIIGAMAYVWHRLGMRVEGSGAAALAPVLAGRTGGRVEGDLVVVLTGRNVDDDVFRRVVEVARHC